MDFTGLGAGYPVNRPIAEPEQRRQLRQKTRLNIVPRYQLCVIKMNSTFLESTDKWYAWKGALSAIAIVAILMPIIALGWICIQSIFNALDKPTSGADRDGLIWFSIVALILIFFNTLFIAWFLRKESFSYTHYPIRFNRKTRMLHVFRTNGTVSTISWDAVFFTIGHLPMWDEWEVQGHVLDKDGNTVIESFALSYVGSLSARDKVLDCSDPSSEDFVRAHWEFIRRYMEEGPQAVSSQIEFCMPIAAKKESFYVGFHRIFANIARAPTILFLFLAPFCMLFSLARVFAMRTSKIPQWPSSIESACAIETDDPHAIEGAPDGTRIAVFPDAAKSAGVTFNPVDFGSNKYCGNRGRRN